MALSLYLPLHNTGGDSTGHIPALVLDFQCHLSSAAIRFAFDKMLVAMEQNSITFFDNEMRPSEVLRSLVEEGPLPDFFSTVELHQPDLELV
jgi:hypothetical protein